MNISVMRTPNGYKNKRVNSSYGSMSIDVPQDRNSSFEPNVVKKRRKDISDIEMASFIPVNPSDPLFRWIDRNKGCHFGCIPENRAPALYRTYGQKHIEVCGEQRHEVLREGPEDDLYSSRRKDSTDAA